MNNFWRLRSRDSTIASDSTTVLKSFIGKHKWVIKNWRNLIPANAMDQDMQQAILLSDTFAIEVEDDVGGLERCSTSYSQSSQEPKILLNINSTSASNDDDKYKIL